MAINFNLNTDEKTYQNYFYDKIIGDNLTLQLDRSTDGYIDGTIFEHKLNVSSYGRSKALSQVLIYLTRFNRDGIPVPKNIMLVSQEEKKVYLYDSNDYVDIINNISKYATLQASTGIEGFKEKASPRIISYDLDNFSKCKELMNILEQEPEYTKINIDVHNVYGWVTYFYQNAKKPKKIEFFKEIRKPKKELSKFINPWTGNESDFALIMDLLNDPQQQKKLGAFYTPPLYAKKAVELVRKAIKGVPEGNDYIILDRCAGTGILEIELTEEELSHVIVSTYELKEWHALKDRLGKLVRHVIPPIPKNESAYPQYDKSTGFLSGANALEKSFLERKEIMQYVNNPKCNIIIFENPPYADDSADTPKTGESRGNSKGNYIAQEMNKNVKSIFPGLIQSKEIANLFIWSGFNYYLRKPNDAYILFSPIKYWKTGHLVNKEFGGGFAFNRQHFHATKSMVSCIYWKNIDCELNEITLNAYDIKDNTLEYIKDIKIKKIYKSVNEHFFDKREDSMDIANGIYSQRNGTEGVKGSSTATLNIYNKNIIGWLHLVGFGFDSKNINLTRNTLNLRKNGFYLRDDNFIEKLPLFCAKAYPQEHWYETDVYSTSADGGDLYKNDKNFLKKSLIYTCLTQKNRCRSLNGSDGRYYRNELCFDGENTVASKALVELLKEDKVILTNHEIELLKEYKELLEHIKSKDECGNYIYEEYNSNYLYGTFQISDEINVKIIIGYDKNGKEKYGPKYGDLNNRLSEFKRKVQKYYNENLVCDLLKYELLK
ncbi:MAG: hypothetical protein IJ086_15865 [Clostridium sp.]|nr:hypothetical protein [Clostridium sp.]MBQ9000151.1 hypothetical protein [Clostridium sp.]